MATTLYTGVKKVYRGDSNSKYWNFRIRVILNSQDILSNTSNVTLTVDFAYYTSGGTIWSSSGNRPITYIYNGTTQLVSTTYGSNSYVGTTSYKTLATYTGDFQHNNDGTLTINPKYRFSRNGNTLKYLPKETGTVDCGDVELPTIPRFATLYTSADSIAINPTSETGDTLVVTVTPNEMSPSYIDNLYYKIGDGEYTQISYGADYKVTYQPESLLAIVGRNQTTTITFKVETTNEIGEIIGSNNATVNVSTNIVPFSLYQNSEGAVGIGFGIQADSVGWSMAIPMNPEKPFMKYTEVHLFDNKTVSASSSLNDSFTFTPTENYVAFALGGYRIINASSSGTNSSNSVVTQFALTDTNTIKLYIANRGTSSMKIQMYAYVIEVYAGG